VRLFISADIEGVAGVVSRETSMPSGFEYSQAREWMTAEVVTICEAAFEQGVKEVVVADSHGNGQNILIDKLPANVTLIRSWPRPLLMMQGIEDGAFDGAILQGYHTGASYEGGVLGHTIYGTVIHELKLNGKVMSEAGVSAAVAGEYNVPIILATGDEAFADETRALLGDIEFAAVKTSYSTLSAKTMTPKDGRTLIRAKTIAAIQRQNTIKPFKVEPPITLDIRFKHRMPAEVLSWLPCVERTDGYSIQYCAESMVDVSKFLTVVTSYKPSLM